MWLLRKCIVFCTMPIFQFNALIITDDIFTELCWTRAGHLYQAERQINNHQLFQVRQCFLYSYCPTYSISSFIPTYPFTCSIPIYLNFTCDNLIGWPTRILSAVSRRVRRARNVRKLIILYNAGIIENRWIESTLARIPLKHLDCSLEISSF